MTEKIDQNVNVLMLSVATKSKVSPVKIRWKDIDYTVIKIGLHHKYHKGRTQMHVYSVIVSSPNEETDLFMQLRLNTNNLIWTLEEVGYEVK